MKTYDLIIIGAGLSGIIAAIKAAESGLTLAILEKGHDQKKRHGLISGWLGRSLYTMSHIEADFNNFNNSDTILDYCREANGGKIELFQGIKDFSTDLPFKIFGKSYYQTGPKFGKELSQQLYKKLSSFNNVDIIFNEHVKQIEYSHNFIIHTNNNIFGTQYCLISTGKNSTSWIQNICLNLNIKYGCPDIRIGLRVEAPDRLFRPFIQIVGDFQIKDDKVLLDDLRPKSLIGDFDDPGFLSAFPYVMINRPSKHTNFLASIDFGNDLQEAIRIVRIINVLSNDKIKHEYLADFVKGRGVLEHLKQFSPIRETLVNFSKMIPSFLNCATVHIPEVKIGGALLVDEKMRTSFVGLYGSGECTSKVTSLFGAMASGLVAINSIMEDKNGRSR